MLFTSVPVNALNISGSDLSESTTNETSSEENNSSTELATDSNLSEDTSISDRATLDSEELSSNDIDSFGEKLNNEISLQSDNTEDEEEPSTDNWELGLVFYDSSVDGGKTPLTSIDWDASDGGYGEGTPRVITVQINYKNTNAVTTYQPGELELKIDGLLKDAPLNDESFNSEKALQDFKVSWVIGANDATHTGYDWNYKADYISFPYTSNGTYYPNILNINNITFSNANVIEEKSNFEGSIQIQYTVEPGSRIVKYENESTSLFDKTLKVVLNESVESNTIDFNYKRTYIHPWKKILYPLTKKAEKITSFDGLGENCDDYIWVKYTFSTTGSIKDEYPYITANKFKIEDEFPLNCKVIDGKSYEVLEADNGKYEFPFTYSSYYNYDHFYSIFVGYPKSDFNEELDNLNISNYAELYAFYRSETDYEYQDDDEVSLNLAEFRFQYSGELYGIGKRSRNLYERGHGSFSDSNYYTYYQSLSGEYIDIGNKGRISFEHLFSGKYVGKPYDLKIGDDLLFITSPDGSYRKLEDEEYYVNCIQFPILYDGNGNSISNKYDVDLYVRNAGETEYQLYTSFLNSSKHIVFSSKNIVGYYFVIKNITTNVNFSYAYNNSMTCGCNIVINNAKDIATSGRVYNFAYIEAYIDGALQNEPTIDSYDSFITKDAIANYDSETYGHYLQRACAVRNYSYFTVPKLEKTYYTKKSMTSFTQDANNECFFGTATLEASTGNNYITFNGMSEESYLDLYGKDQFEYNEGCTGFDIYDLLPVGMDLISTKEEIKNNIIIPKDTKVYNINKEALTQSELLSLIKENSSVEIIHNWNSTGRTWIHINIDLGDNPVFHLDTGYYSSSYAYIFSTNYDYEVSYDSFLEYGSVWENAVNTKCFGNQFETKGTTIEDVLDLNGDGNTTEKMAYAKAIATITSVVSTHQDVTKYVQTDKSNYSTGTVKASPDSEYTYKLRVRTGQNDVTNLVIYDSVEEYAQDKDGIIVPAYGTKKHWNGSFLGIDTSYAEAKGYVVKPYYSENKLAGNLYNEDGSLNTDWKEYSESDSSTASAAVDKSKVKSLAFEYLDKDDETQKAVLPANSQTYVLVKMKAPPEENRKVLAYNGCRTQWNALDDYDRPVDFITGINSNIVKVSLSDYYDLTVNKVWNDENNKWGLRPDSVDIILKKDGTEVERKQITKDNLSVTFTDLLVEDSDRYTIEEESLSLYSSTIEYNELEDCYEVTNTLKNDIFKDISGTKTWVGDKESKRPDSITIKLLKDGEVYRTTTTGAEKNWKYSFTKVPIYNADETRCIYSVEEESVDKYTVQYAGNSKGLTIKFNSQFKTESVSYDYVEIYYKQDGQTYKLGRWGGTALAGQTVNVPTNDFYLYWRTDGSGNNYYGFSIDSIEAADVNTTGTAATLPNYTATELTGNEYPETAHNPYPNSQNLLWHYTGDFTSNLPAEGLFNIVNTYEGVDAINLSFIKAIEGTDEAFEKLQLKKDDLYKFQISMKNRETGNIISVPIDNKNTVTVNEMPIGTYVITEKDDMYFDFVSMETLNSVEGVTFEKVSNDYVLTITDAASDEETLQIKVNNEIEPDRPYEDKKERVNLFDWTSAENSEEVNLLSRIANFFKN